VQVLDQEQHRLLLCERLEHREQRLEDARLRGGLRSGSTPDAGENRVEGGAELGRQSLEGGIALAHQGPEGGEQRGVRELVFAELYAVPGEDTGAGLARVTRQLVGKPGLADA
jgi:hypothetical protein